MMRALVVYESMWGNTAQVAAAIARGLSESMTVDVFDVHTAPAAPADDVDLVVVGGPTHAFSMTRASTREEAVRLGAPAQAVGIGLREWLDGLTRGHHRQVLATFGTRVEKVRHLPGSSAKNAAKVARQHGFRLAAPPESFYVHDMGGPLLNGELDRATAWGRQLTSALAAASA